MAHRRDIFFHTLLAALAAGPVLFPEAGVAATASFSVGAAAMSVTGSATLGGSVNLPNNGSPVFGFGFVIPRDHVAGTNIRLVVYLQSPGAACSVVLSPTAVVRRRPGEVALGDLASLEAQDGSNEVAFPGASAVVAKTFVLSPGAVYPQRKGDMIDIQLQRVAGSASDTCAGSVFATAVDIRYSTP